MKGLIWILSMKLKYGEKVDCFYFPFLGANFKIIIG